MAVIIVLLVGWHLLGGALLWHDGRLDASTAWLGARPIPSRVAIGGWEPGALSRGDGARLITRLLVHGSLWHLLINLSALTVLTLLIAPLLSSRLTLAIAIVGGLIGGALSSATGPAHSDGASACASALLGAGLVAAASHPTLSTARRRLLRNGLGLAAGLDLLTAAFLPRLDLAAHTGGLLAGAILTLWAYRSPQSRFWTYSLIACLWVMASGIYRVSIPLLS